MNKKVFNKQIKSLQEQAGNYYKTLVEKDSPKEEKKLFNHFQKSITQFKSILEKDKKISIKNMKTISRLLEYSAKNIGKKGQYLKVLTKLETAFYLFNYEMK